MDLVQPHERIPAGNYSSQNWESLAIKYYLAFPFEIERNEWYAFYDDLRRLLD